MDFRPVLSAHAAISYMSAKLNETQSKSYQDILQTVVGQTIHNPGVAVVYQKMLSSFLGEQDISGDYLIKSSSMTTNITSAQEVCHTLSGCQIWVSSRQVRSLKVSEGTSDEVVFNLHPSSTSLYEQYMLGVLMYLKIYHSTSSISGMMLGVEGEYKKCGAFGVKPYVVDVWPWFVGNPTDTEAYEISVVQRSCSITHTVPLMIFSLAITSKIGQLSANTANKHVIPLPWPA